MDSFFGYNQIQIKSKDQHKTTFIFRWGTFAYWKMPFGLKNVGATFQRAMTLIFHDLKKIIEVYLDDLISHSRLRVCHPYHLCLVFEICCSYQIQLNPHKCIFCVKVSRLLGFIVSKEGIRLRQYFNCLDPCITFDISNVCKVWPNCCEYSWSIFPI